MPKSKKALEWHRKNAWFGEDQIKTTHALILHEILIRVGVNPATIKYFEAIDSYMAYLHKYGLDKEVENERT